MSESQATLRLIVDTGDVGPATDALDKLGDQAKKTEKQVDNLGDAAKRTGSDFDHGANKFARWEKLAFNLGGALGHVTAQLIKYGSAAASIAGTLLFKESIDAARTAAQALAQVEKGIESTGGAAKRTVEDIKRLTAEIQENSLFGDEFLQVGAANLLTFTNITETAFDRTLKVAADVSTRVGTDFKSQIIQLGKALNDPIANLGALSRVGIQFSDTQQKTIKYLVEENRLFDAQNLILTEIERQYGGSAKAAREAGGGATAAKDAFGDLLEIIGGRALDKTNEGFERLTKTLQDPDTQVAAEKLGIALADVFDLAIKGLELFINKFSDFLNYLEDSGFIRDRETNLKFNLTAEVKPSDVSIEALEAALKGEDRTIKITLDQKDLQKGPFGEQQVIKIAAQLDDQSVENIKKRLAEIDARRREIRDITDTNRPLGEELANLPKQVNATFELKDLGKEAENLKRILSASATVAREQKTEFVETAKAAGETAGATGELLINIQKVFDSGLDKRVEDLKRLAEAALQGPDAVKAVQDEIDINNQLADLKAKADKAEEVFDEARERRHLQELKRLQKQLEINQQIADFRDQSTARPVYDRLQNFNNAIRAPGLSSSSSFQRDQSFTRAQAALDRLQSTFLELADKLSPDLAKELEERVVAASEDFQDAVDKSAQDWIEGVQRSSKEFAASLIDDLIFNRGRGIGDIFKQEAARGIKNIVSDNVGSFLSGDDTINSFDELIKAMQTSAEDFSEKFEKIGEQFDKLFGTDGTFSKVLGKAAQGFAGFQFGSGAADIFNGGAGETGSKIGAAVGGAIGTAIPVIGTFLGSAFGGFFGDIFGGLFGRKTATGTASFDTGLFTGADSTKDSRNEARDQILNSTFESISRLAAILGSRVLTGAQLEVSVGKKAITASIINEITGQILATSTSGKGDIQGAINKLLSQAINTILEGGDERLKRIATALTSGGAPSDKVVSVLEGVASALKLTEPPSSQFIDQVKQLTDVFKDATILAQRWGGATRDLLEIQKEALDATAAQFDKSIASQRRAIENPIAQQAFDLIEAQQLRLREATTINDALIQAADALTSAVSGAGQTSGGFDPNTYLRLNPDVSRAAQGLSREDYAYIQRFGYSGDQSGYAKFHYNTFGINEGRQTTDPAALIDQLDGTTQSTNELEAAQQRLDEVIKLNTAEWNKFIKDAGSSPQAFQAAAAALRELQASAEDFPLAADQLEQSLELVRQSLASDFDEAIKRRKLQFTNPAQLQLLDIIKSQAEFVQAARDVSKGPEDLAQRLAAVAEANQAELHQFVLSNSDSAKQLQEAAAALQAFADDLRAQGVDPNIAARDLEQARLTLVGEANQGQIDRILKIVSNPTAELKALIERQRQDVLSAQQLGSNVDLVQRANYLELEKFLSALSDSDLESIGDVTKIIVDGAGRLPAVLLDLDATFKRFIDNRQEEISKANQLGQRGADLQTSSGNLARDFRARFGGQSPLQQFENINDEFLKQLAIAQDTTLDPTKRLDAISRGNDLASQVVDQISRTFGGLGQGKTAIDEVTGVLDQFAQISGTISQQQFSLEDALQNEYDVLVQIRDKIQSPDTDALAFVADQLAAGNVSIDEVTSLLTEYVNLSRVNEARKDEVKDSIKQLITEGLFSSSQDTVSPISSAPIVDAVGFTNNLLTNSNQTLDGILANGDALLQSMKSGANDNYSTVKLQAVSEGDSKGTQTSEKPSAPVEIYAPAPPPPPIDEQTWSRLLDGTRVEIVRGNTFLEMIAGSNQQQVDLLQLMITRGVDAGQKREADVQTLAQSAHVGAVSAGSSLSSLNFDELVNAFSSAFQEGFKGEVSIRGTVTINDQGIISVLKEVLAVLNQIEDNQYRGGTEARLNILSRAA